MSKIEVNEIDAQSGSTITVGSACKSVAVPGNVLKTNAVQASDGGNIINQCGATITIGANDDTVVLGTGAAFGGGVGAVKWETTPQTGSFGAVAGRGYFMNTTSGPLTLTLPASPSAGDIVSIADYTRTFSTNNCTIGRNSQPIGGVAADAVLSTSGQAATFVYVDGTEGWINVQETSSSIQGTVEYVCATGGTTVNSGDYTYHTFTGPATFCVAAVSNTTPSRNNVCMMVVAGGGGGGSNHGGGGGGAGGYREFTSVPITAQGYPITVGAGGNGGPANTSGSPSTAISNTSTGGGAGGNQSNFGPMIGAQTGGSGGGAAGGFETQSGAAGNTPPVSPPQGNSGGNAIQPVPSPSPTSGYAGGAGGGGATGSGSTPSGSYPFTGGAGGNGSNNLSAWATATSTGDSGYYAGGGGGGGWCGPGGNGGAGGGGDGGDTPEANAPSGSANTGGGGGGSNAASPARVGGTGGSGIVIIRYKFQN